MSIKYQYKPKTELENFALSVYQALVENFPQTFFVGGMVRDLLLLKTINDIDIATEATPEKTAECLKKYYIDVNLGYVNMGVVLASNKNFTVSISSFRKDLPAKNRYPKIQYVKSVKLDAQRRDFTINSLYLSPKLGKILDFFDGLKGLNKKFIKFIGQPEEKIKQDPLRIARALRFALTLNFKIEKKSFQAIKNNYFLLSSLTASRIKKEIGKLTNKKHREILSKTLSDKKMLDKYFKTS